MTGIVDVRDVGLDLRDWLINEGAPAAAGEMSVKVAAALYYQFKKWGLEPDLRRVDGPLIEAAVASDRLRIIHEAPQQVWLYRTTVIGLTREMRRLAIPAKERLDLPALPFIPQHTTEEVHSHRVAYDIHRRLSYADPAAATGLGFHSPTELLGADVLTDLTPWWEQPHRADTLVRTFRGEHLHGEIYVVIRGDWHSVTPTVWYHETPLLDDEGYLAGVYGAFGVAR